jgi:hypothetical protein
VLQKIVIFWYFLAIGRAYLPSYYWVLIVSSK